MLFSTHEETFLTEIQEVLPVSSATSRDKIWPFLDQAERKYIRPLLSTLYADVDKFYNDNDNWTGGSGDDTEVYSGLLSLIHSATINLAYFIGFDLLNVIASDAGFQQTGDNQGFKSLYKYQQDNLRTYFSETGYNGLDDMLTYIEENIEYFPQWEASAVNTARKTAIIKDADQFDALCFINRSRLTFLRLQRHMAEVIDFEIKPMLSTVWAALLVELESDDPDIAYINLAAEIRKPLAYLSCAKLIEQTGNLTDRGLFFEGKSSGSPDSNYKNPVTGPSAEEASETFCETGRRYLELLRQYLITNEFIVTVAASAVYDRDNDYKKTFVA